MVNGDVGSETDLFEELTLTSEGVQTPPRRRTARILSGSSAFRPYDVGQRSSPRLGSTPNSERVDQNRNSRLENSNSGRRNGGVRSSLNNSTASGRSERRMMFKADFGPAKLLKNVVDVTYKNFPEASFTFSSYGMKMVSMDTSRTSCVEFILMADGFETYECHEHLEFMLSMKNLQKAMSCSDPADSLTIYYMEGKDSLEFEIKDHKFEKLEEISFKLNNENSGTPYSTPDIEFPVKCSLPSEEFKAICDDLESFSDVVTIKARENRFVFCADGWMGHNKITPGRMAEVEVKQPVMQSFGTNVMRQFSRAFSVSGYVEISVASDQPMLIRYPLSGDSFLAFFHASRATDEVPEALLSQQP